MGMTWDGHQSLEDSNQSWREPRQNQCCSSSTWWWGKPRSPSQSLSCSMTTGELLKSIEQHPHPNILISADDLWPRKKVIHSDYKWGLHHWTSQKWRSRGSNSKKILRSGNALPLFTFYWLPDGRSSWTGKIYLIDQVHRKCSTSKWTILRRLFRKFLFVWFIDG